MEEFTLGDINLFFNPKNGRWSIFPAYSFIFNIEKVLTKIYIDGRWTALFEEKHITDIKKFQNRVIITEEKDKVIYRLHISSLQTKMPAVILKLEIINSSREDVLLGPAHILEIDRLPVKVDDTKVFVDSGGSWWAGVVDITGTSPFEEQWEMLPLEDKKLVEKIKGRNINKGFHNSAGGISILYDRKSENSMICSFATFYRAMSNIIWLYKEEGLLYGWAGCDFAGFKLKASKKVFSESLFLGFYQSPFSAFEDYANLSARYMKVKLPRNVPLGWCSWYAYRLDVSEKKVLKNAEMIKKHFPEYNFEYIQVDHGWQYKNICGHWIETNERFPHGIGWLSEKLQEMGFKLGLWLALFTVLESSPIFKNHPECLIKNSKGIPRPMPFLWSWPPRQRIYCLDPTHPESQKFIKDTLSYLRKAGVRYWKIDFTWRIAIRDDNAVYYNQDYIKGAEIYRKGLYLVEKTLNGDYIYWCSNPTNLGFGLGSTTMVADDIDNTGFRTGKDLKEATGYGGKPITLEDFRRKATTIISRYFLHNKLTLINPDVLEVGPPGDYEEAKIRFSVVALCGGQVFLGDDLTKLKKKHWELLSKCIPPLGKAARPVDLFEHTWPASYPQIWHLPLRKRWGRWDIAGLFNLSREMAEIKIEFTKLGLIKEKKYIVFEFWEKKILGIVSDSITVNMLPVTTKLLLIKEYPSYPAVLSTDMHLSQGAVELKDVMFDKKKNILKGIAKRQKGEKGNIFIFVPDGYTIIGRKDIKQKGKGLYILPVFFNKSEIKWEIKFIKKFSKK